MFLSFRTDGSGQYQTALEGTVMVAVKVHTIYHSAYIFWTHYTMAKPPCSNFRVITAIFLGCLKFLGFYGITHQQVRECVT